MTEFCRICFVYNEELITLIKSNINDLELSKSGDMFEQCLNIMLNSVPQYKICMDCNIQLKYFYDFKIKALKAHEKLVNIYHITEEENVIETVLIHNNNNETNIESIIENVQDIDSVFHIDIGDDNILLENEDINDNTNGDFNYEIEYLENEMEIQELQQNLTQNMISEQFKVDEELNDLKVNRINLEITSSDNTVLKNHLKQKYRKPKKCLSENFQCLHCEKRFRSEKTYSAHINKHNGLSPWICEICGKGFRYRVNYNYHMKNHDNKRSFICTICSKGYICKWDLKIHESVHTKTRPFNCEFCDKSFRIQSHWKQHLQTHSQTNTFECIVCQQKYKSRASLKIHINSIHTDTKFPCNLCDKSFNRKHHLVVHLKRHANKEYVKNI